MPTSWTLIARAVGCGFSSVMIDGSSLPFEENVKLTQAAVQLARPKGISVEAELGHVGGMDLESLHRRDNVLTEPDEVARFVQQTGVDSLAGLDRHLTRRLHLAADAEHPARYGSCTRPVRSRWCSTAVPARPTIRSARRSARAFAS